MNFNQLKSLAIFLIIPLVITACSKKKQSLFESPNDPAPPQIVSPTPPPTNPLEAWGSLPALLPHSSCTTQQNYLNTLTGLPTDYCAQTTSFTGSTVTVFGQANYNYRPIIELGGTLAQLSNSAQSKPIRYAEVAIYKNNTLIQCTHTDENGAFSFQIPQNTRDGHKVLIRSRSYTAKSQTSILKNYLNPTHYSLESIFVANETKSIPAMSAAINSGDKIGGAFFLLDQIITANEWLVENTSDCDSFSTRCQPFTPKQVSLFWEHDKTGGEVLGDNDATSFYISHCYSAFISGEKRTGRIIMDTFSPSVILHEYFHFLESAFSASDSPGGSHAIKDPVDPRLAFSEAMAYFFQAAVLGQARLIDFIGLCRYKDGCSSSSRRQSSDSYTYLYALFNFSFETGSRSTASCSGDTRTCSLRETQACTSSSNFSGCDWPQANGEGHFREGTLIRYFWDLYDNTPSESLGTQTDNVSIPFDAFWALITSSNYNDDTYNLLRAVGSFNKVGANLSFDNWSRLQNYSKLASSTPYTKYEIKKLGTEGCQSFLDNPPSMTLSPSQSNTNPSVITDGALVTPFITKNPTQDHLYLKFPHPFPLEDEEPILTIRYKKSDPSSTINLPIIAGAVMRAESNVLGYEEGESSRFKLLPSTPSAANNNVFEVSATFPTLIAFALDIAVHEGKGTPIDIELLVNGTLYCPQY